MTASGFAPGLLDAQAGDGPGDHQLLDLLGALEDVEGVPTPFSEHSPLQYVRSRPPGPARSGGVRRVLVPE
jgi:hypothetical protein